jgi:hypothetical protein
VPLLLSSTRWQVLLSRLSGPGLDHRRPNQTRQRVEPTIRVDEFPSAVSATRDGDRVVVTAHAPAGFVTMAHDGRTGAPIAGSLT